MVNYSEILYGSPLFLGMTRSEIASMLTCLAVRVKKFTKSEIIFMSGQPAREIGIILSGEAHIVQDDVFGNRTILAHIGAGDMFGEAYACAKAEKLPVTVPAVAESMIIFIDCGKIITTCKSSCVFHTRLIGNLMSVLANKNIMLSKKIAHVSHRTTREKLLSYFSEQVQINGTNEFIVPFNRQEMADYLCVDRSAMSSELGRMRDEGILEFEKNHFQLHKMSESMQ